MVTETKPRLWAYSLTDGEDYVEVGSWLDTLADGEEAARDDDRDEFYVAPIVGPDLEQLAVVDAGLVLEQAVERSVGTAFEAPEDSQWLQKVRGERLAELERELSAVFKAWLQRHHLEPDWFFTGKAHVFTVGDVGRPPEPGVGNPEASALAGRR